MVILAYVIRYKEHFVHEKAQIIVYLYAERDAHQENFEHKTQVIKKG